MKKLFVYLSLVAFAAVGIACAETAINDSIGDVAQTSNVANADVHQDEGRDAPRISLADAKKDFDENTAVFIDTHSKEQFELEHIPGAINIPGNAIKQNMNKVPKGKKIIAYCS
ncbi:MAG TPA: rhodanese-like domain-containing protein [Pyrinomonadaceae bacterium]|nr:rhodanese-like domain-containing protein [Pyrinomonadaceae bacterium]